MSKNTPLTVLICLLLAACIAMASYLICYRHSYEIAYADLEIESYEYAGGVLTLRVSSEHKGEYLYKVLSFENGTDGELEVSFRGGKQPTLAQDAGKTSAEFRIEIPAGTVRVVCGSSTVYTFK